MKKIYFKMMALMASAMMCLGVYAQDAIEPTIISPTIAVGEAYTSVEALKDAHFAITAEGKALYGSDNQNAAFNDYAQAFKSTNSGYQWRLLEVNAESSYYQLQLVTPAGQDYAIWGNPVGVLNSQAATGWCSFILNTNQDIPDGSTYEILYVEGQGFTIKNVGTGLYQGADAAPANKETPTYFTLAPVTSTYVPALEAMLAEGEAWKAIIDNAEAVAAYDAAIAGIDPATTEDALADAKKVDLAISELAKAQNAAAGVNFTRAIVNPSFELGDRTGWEENYGGNTSGTANFGKKTGAIFLERWTSSADGGKLSDGYIQQTISGLPNGTYKLTAEMQNLEQANDPATDGKGYFLVANDDSTEVAVAGETVEVTTEVTDGTITIAAAIKGCTGNWVCVDNFQLTLVEAAPVIAEATYTIDVERFPGLGYSVTTVPADLTEALAFLGVETATTDMLSIVNPDGTEISEYATYDGWFAADGSPINWGNDSKVCVKFFQALSGGSFEICDMNGADEVGKTYTFKWALKANEKTAFFNINVTYVEVPQPELAISETVIKAAVEYDTAVGSYAEQIVMLSDEDVQAILTELGLASLEEATVYGYNPTTEELVANYAGYDGWRDANGDFAFHTGDATVPACVKYTDGKNYYCYSIAGCEAQDIKTYWAIANAEKAVLVEITFSYVGEEEPEPEIGTVIHTIDFAEQASYPYYVMTAPEGSSFDVIDGALVIENTVEQANFWDLQPFVCDWFSLKAGYDYIVRITMKADTDGSATIGMGTWSASMSKQLEFTAGTEYQKYNVEFPASTVESANNDVHVLFQAGKYVGKVEIAKVEIIEIVPVAIESVETAAPAAQKNGKYMENGKLVIIKNGKKFNAAGQAIK